MKGIDEDWTQTADLQTVRYFLPPGKYVLQVFASRFFNKEAQPMKEINIVVRPPFWKTWWFLTGISLFVLGSMAFIINQNNRKVYAKKLLALEAEHRIQLERERISRELHDDLGTRVNMLAYNTSLLDENNSASEIKTIKERIQETSGEMLQSLRETVWTLKQEEITATDVWTRFKNFIAKMQRTYSKIQFKIEEEEVPEMKMNSNEALNTIRILQEAVNNAVKHASCTVIKCKKGSNGKKIVFVIEDNGKGMNAQDTATVTGNGIENMRHRANESSFELKVISIPGQGSLVSLSI
jgi:signal transduction histidine kinase